MKKLLMALTISLVATNGFAYINGKDAKTTDFPFTVAFPDLTCTGAKISEYKYLLAAHCMTSPTGPNMIYSVGDKINMLIPSEDGKLMLIRSTITKLDAHYSYVWKIAEVLESAVAASDPNVIDLAYIEIADTTPMPIGDIDTSPLKKGESIIVGGFGCQYETEVNIIKSKFKNNLITYKFAEKTVKTVKGFVAGMSVTDSDKKTKSVGCPGDSGGPAYRRTESGRLKIIGVNTFIGEKNDTHIVNLTNQTNFDYIRDK